MSKTFKSIVSDRHLLVDTYKGGPNLIIGNLTNSPGISVAASDAPALALAILEAAGVKLVPADSYKLGSLDQLRDAAHELRMYVNYQAEAAKEAADREALEREAMDFYRAGIEPGVSDWNLIHEAAQEMWLRVARHARTVNGAKS